MPSTTLTFHPKVAEFLSRSPLKAVIGGQEVPSSNGQTFQTHDPGSGEVLASVFAMQRDDVDRAVQAGGEAFQRSGWPKLAPNERAVLLHRLADAVAAREEIIAQIEAYDCGKVLYQAVLDVKNFVETIRYFADLSQHCARRTPLAVAGHEAWSVRIPWGVCGFIFPWNFPLLLVGWNIAPALAAGNTVVIKPAEDTPLSTIYLAHLAKEVGIPDGVINVVPGFGDPAGAALAGYPRIKRMSFTGSPEVGRLIGEACGRNLVPVKLELGGKGAALVFDDVDVAGTVEKLVGAVTYHTGQVCCTATRWLIHRSIYDRFVDLAVQRMKQIVIGHEMDPKTQMGPVVSEKQRQRILGYLKRGCEGGAELVLEGGEARVPNRNGCYVKPALLAGPRKDAAWREEIFGPVAYLAPFADEAEAVAMVNDTDYGLGNSVWTADLGRAQRVADAMVSGNSWINGHNIFLHGVPYAGVNKSGMGGGVMSVGTLFDYWRHLSVVRPL